MSVRLTMSVSGKVRWAKVDPAHLIPKAIDKLITQAYELNRDYVPKGKTGKLQASFTHEKGERSVRFYWEAPYANYVDKGTKPDSPGRYVPAIGKRLVNTELSPRRQVYQAVLARGYSKKEARVALTTPIKELPGKSIVAFKSRTPGYPDIEAYGIYEQRTKSIEIAAGGPHKAATIRHELAHAVQHKAGELEPSYARYHFPEPRAEYLAKIAAGQRKNIGTHPGVPRHHFSQHIVNLLKAYTVDWMLDEVRAA